MGLLSDFTELAKIRRWLTEKALAH